MIRYANILPGLILYTASASADVVEESLQQADILWDKTVEYAGATLDRARRLWREEHPEDAQLWEDLIPRLDEIIVLQDRQRQLPESAWFRDDQASNTDDINALLDEVAAILIGDNTLRERMRGLTAAMAENRQAVVAFQPLEEGQANLLAHGQVGENRQNQRTARHLQPDIAMLAAAPAQLVEDDEHGHDRKILHQQDAHGILANNEWYEGWLDEGIQALLPNRVDDIRDVGFNALAGLMAITARLAISS